MKKAFLVVMAVMLLGLFFNNFSYARAASEAVVQTHKYAIGGDSITWQAIKSAKFNSSVLKLAVPGSTVESLMRRLYLKLPEDIDALSVLIGVNNLLNGKTPEEVAEAILVLLTAVLEWAPKADIFLISVLPTRAGDTINIKIDILNKLLVIIVNDMDRQLEAKGLEARILYVDFHTLFAETDMLTGKEEFVRDRNVHLTEEGQKLLRSLIVSYIQ